MSNIKLLKRGVPVSEIHWALQSHPELWNEFDDRTRDPSSPHHGLDDIWARFGDREFAKNGQPHFSKWYPAADVLGIKPICHEIMHMVGGSTLGGVLITRIPPGAECKPHSDIGWHAQQYDKFALQITSAPGQAFCFEGESLESRPGDLYWFRNDVKHWVVNLTPYERITMIVCVRMED